VLQLPLPAIAAPDGWSSFRPHSHLYDILSSSLPLNPGLLSLPRPGLFRFNRTQQARYHQPQINIRSFFQGEGKTTAALIGGGPEPTLSGASSLGSAAAH